MSILLIIFGLLSGCLLSVLVGFVGAQRNIGFGWTFIISLIFSPIVGLICALLSSPLSTATPRKWGCLGVTLSIIGVLLFIPFCMFWATLMTALLV